MRALAPSPRAPVLRRLGLLCCAALVAAGCTDDLPQVQTQRVASGSVRQTVSAPARIAPAAQRDVTAGVSGVVASLQVSDGERVRKGQTVLRLSSEQVDLAREQAAAAERAANGVGGVSVDGTGDETLAQVSAAVRRLEESTVPRITTAREHAKQIHNPDQRRAALASVDAVQASYEATRAALLASGQAIAAQQDASSEALASALNQAVGSATAG
ncbi:MAG: biotin/lipoyl-binding protein, partial [Euzebyales bacterium]|nr:biotin/lipoyl-binding protein [Euzebyales bacterium]